MKRFYKQAEAGTAPGGHVVRLDGTPLRTPLRTPVILSSAPMAAAIAAEWAAQGDEIVPASMPLTQLVCTMIDKAQGHERPDMEAEIVKYAGSDLICYLRRTRLIWSRGRKNCGTRCWRGCMTNTALC